MESEQKPNAATQAKKRWNANHYAVIKVSVDPDVAAAFKKACAFSNVSMASELVKFMAKYSNVTLKRKPKPDYTSRRQRRAAVRSIVQQIEQIRDAEEQSRDNVPENLQGSAVYETAEESISSLEEAIELLDSIY
jgi:hypothetical protein